ncbi:MAG: helix-turn-helix domain-containing protein [Gemmatimonadales bacterium]
MKAARDLRRDPPAHFRCVSRAASPLGAPLIEQVWTVEAARCSASVEAALPDGAAELYFNLGPIGRLQLRDGGALPSLAPSLGWVLGPRAGTVLVAKETRDCAIVGVRLQPGVAALLLGVPAAELAGRLTDLEDLVGRGKVAEVVDRLAGAGSVAARLGHVERAVVGWCGAPHDVVRVSTLVRRVAASGAGSIRGVADELGMSHRRVIDLCRRAVGLTPKRLQRVGRLRSILERAHGSERPSWAGLAAECGFVDQAHLIHEFRALAGMTPSAYLTGRMAVGVGFVRHRAA